MTADQDPRREVAARALASGSRPVEAAAVAGVSNRTLRRWRKDPEFKGLVERFAAEAGDQGDHADRLIETLTRQVELDPSKVSAAAVALLEKLLSRRAAVRGAENGGGGRAGEILDKLFEGEATAADLDAVGVSEAQRTAYAFGNRNVPPGAYFVDDGGQVFALAVADDGPILAAVEAAREAAAVADPD